MLFMRRLGNSTVNQIFEANYKHGESAIVRPTPESDRAHKELWIVAKYVDKTYLKTSQDEAMLIENPIHLV